MASQELILNDIHSQLNETAVRSILRPTSVEEMKDAIFLAVLQGSSVSVMGARHAMGGQQFGRDTVSIDMSQRNQILHFDPSLGTIEIEAGITWPALIEYLNNEQKDPGDSWAIIQKQTGADELTIGGSLSANIHGRGLKLKPFIADIESFKLLNAKGEVLTCSRSENQELFCLGVGGYGLFGVVISVTLRLIKKQKLMRIVEIIRAEELLELFARRIADHFLYGDFQFNTDRDAEDFLTGGVFACYKAVPFETPQTNRFKELSPDEWIRLFTLGHVDHQKAYEMYSAYYLSTSGQIYDSDTHQLSYYPRGYHLQIDRAMGSTSKATEMITEIYVPRPEIASFLEEAAAYFRKNKTEVFYGTVRLVEKDEESFLAWAKESYICIIFNLHVVHTKEGLRAAIQDFQHLIDLAIQRNGSFYLTYHRWARRDQIEACYPKFVEFLKLKKKHDADEVFQSEWYRHYRKLFADQL